MKVFFVIVCFLTRVSSKLCQPFPLSLKCLQKYGEGVILGVVAGVSKSTGNVRVHITTILLVSNKYKNNTFYHLGFDTGSTNSLNHQWQPQWNGLLAKLKTTAYDEKTLQM